MTTSNRPQEAVVPSGNRGSSPTERTRRAVRHAEVELTGQVTR